MRQDLMWARGHWDDRQACVSLNHPLNQGAAAASTQKVVCVWHCLVDSDGLHILGGFVVVFFPFKGGTVTPQNVWWIRWLCLLWQTESRRTVMIWLMSWVTAHQATEMETLSYWRNLRHTRLWRRKVDYWRGHLWDKEILHFSISLLLTKSTV